MSSVTGFSHLEYVFAAAEVLRNSPDHRATSDDIKEAIKKVAKERLHQWLIKVGWRFGEQHLPKKIIDDCLQALKKWKLVKQEGMYIKATDEILFIGELLEKKQDIDARRMLLNSIWCSSKELPFHPSNILMKIRDSGPEHKIKMVFSGIPEKVEENGRRKCITLEEMSMEIPFITESGVALDDGSFVKEKLRTNFRAFDVMRDWGVFFELLDYRSLEPGTMNNLLSKYASPNYLDELAKKHGCKSVRIERPKQMVYLTVRIASLSELMDVHRDELNKPNLNDFAQSCIKEILSELNFTTHEEISVEKIIESGLSKGIFFVSDGPDVYGFIGKDSFNLINPHRTYALMRPKVTLEDFKACVNKIHDKLSNGRPMVPVWIGDLAELVCAELRIPESLFKELLLKLKLMGAVFFHKAPMFIAGVKRRRRLPIVDETGRSYQMVSLR
jgi:hypothetical protein